MKLLLWSPDNTPEQSKEVGYFDRNMLALHFAEGWYWDDINIDTEIDVDTGPADSGVGDDRKPRYDGWRRCLCLEGGQVNFHIPDDFDVGNLKQIERRYNGHTTADKWKVIAGLKGIKFDE